MNTKTILWGLLAIMLCTVAYQIVGGVSLAMAQESMAGKTAEVWNTTQRAMELLPRLENEVSVFMEDRQDLIDKITTARNDFLAAQEAGDLSLLDNAYESMLAIQVQIEAYPTTDLSDQQSALMYETAGSINRITYARSQLIETQVSYNQSRILFFPIGLIFPRVEILGENANPASPLPTSTFGE